MKSLALCLGAVLSLARALPNAGADSAASKTRSTETYTATTIATIITRETTKLQKAIYSTVYMGTSAAISTVTSGTSTQTRTFPSTVYKTIPASRTVSAPAPPGFTPLLSSSYYTDAIVLRKTTVTTTYTTPYDPNPSPFTRYSTQPHLSYITTATVPSIVDGYYGKPTTVTLSSATHTVHAACQSNNFASKIPTGEGGYGHFDGTPVSSPNVSDVAECCVRCFQTPGCVGGAWYVGDLDGHHDCTFYTKDPKDTTCNPRDNYGTYEDAGPRYFTDTVFNGPCGSVDWVFNSAAYFPQDP